MRNILRFLVIVFITAMILFTIGISYHLTLEKNLRLIFWSFLLELLTFILVYKQSQEVLSISQIAKQFWLYFKSTILIPILVTIILVKEILSSSPKTVIYFYLNVVVMFYAIGMILSLGYVISPKHSILNKIKK